MAVDWGRLTPVLRAGDWTCGGHGRIRPRTGGPVPTCPDCGALAHQVRVSRSGQRQFVAPTPAHCAGPERHPLTAGQMSVGWVPCPCPPPNTHRGHHSWTCRQCTSPSTIYHPPLAVT